MAYVVATPKDLGQKLTQVLVYANLVKPQVSVEIEINQPQRFIAYKFKKLRRQIEICDAVRTDIEALVFNVLTASDLLPYVEDFKVELNSARNVRIILVLARKGPDLRTDSVTSAIFDELAHRRELKVEGEPE